MGEGHPSTTNAVAVAGGIEGDRCCETRLEASERIRFLASAPLHLCFDLGLEGEDADRYAG
ncbi:hypothetical protein [Thermosporothrix hazakensis]|uniref:hypothetical protein n=1 Tax=Thermosporothrix hazakensis TaxID=644383 RepID=UPI000DABEF47|nr:hypothetical protein [Thermosporothrix hazakensis]GCE46316.1 hypothetical protein KTH_11850 [Thermosporothrix hazakensis]GCE46345.1 hypothetical protein KTH_12140 [Thermosporothrix hazakensis]GCE50766.1 hypothetical protein KTH_56350 [Thermosporothrix hazakensis]